ncbi:MAG: hypothetical protein SGI87_12005 [Flavobacteriales bacterium]|nr:hypothetical protein [Flavobacteriales bacterium]
MKQVLLALFIFALSFSSKATDLIVEEFGTLPTYGSIASAVAASVNGDRIIIKNRAGDIPWIENITINKSLTFLSYTNNTQFVVQGSYILDVANGREVNIIGMKNTSGGINTGTGSATSRSMKVSVMDSWLVSGNIDLDVTGIELQCVGNLLQSGSVIMFFGNCIGNEITSGTDPLKIWPGAIASSNDTCHVVGNKLNSTGNGSNAIFVSGSGQVYHIRNNYVQHKGYGIFLTLGSTLSIPNYIWNNTVITNSNTSTTYGIFVTTQANSVCEIMNNILDENASGTTYGIHMASAAQVNAYYNFVDSAFDFEMSGSFTFSGNNVINTTFTVNTNGTLPVGNPGINAGNPAQPYYDLDLTMGDVGAYGGSYTLTNFFPQFTGSSKVYFVKFPFNVRQGSTLSVKAFGYDR